MPSTRQHWQYSKQMSHHSPPSLLPKEIIVVDFDRHSLAETGSFHIGAFRVPPRPIPECSRYATDAPREQMIVLNPLRVKIHLQVGDETLRSCGVMLQVPLLHWYSRPLCYCGRIERGEEWKSCTYRVLLMNRVVPRAWTSPSIHDQSLGQERAGFREDLQSP
jgi:hypothetical protein